MLSVSVTPQFKRMFRKLESSLQTEALEKITLFTDPQNHKQLKVHKLKGRLRGRYSFSVNYKIRIVFTYELKESVFLIAIGDHDVYN